MYLHFFYKDKMAVAIFLDKQNGRIAATVDNFKKFYNMKSLKFQYFLSLFR